jgi:hypothetical protein
MMREYQTLGPGKSLYPSTVAGFEHSGPRSEASYLGFFGYANGRDQRDTLESFTTRIAYIGTGRSGRSEPSIGNGSTMVEEKDPEDREGE